MRKRLLLILAAILALLPAPHVLAGLRFGGESLREKLNEMNTVGGGGGEGLPCSGADGDGEIHFTDVTATSRCAGDPDFTWAQTTNVMTIDASGQANAGIAFALDSNVTYRLTTAAQTASNTSADDLSILLGAGNGTGVGGRLLLQSGAGGSTAAGGAVDITTGAAGGGNTFGGRLTLTGGVGAGSGAGGDIYLLPGVGGATGGAGDVVIGPVNAAASSNAEGGRLTFTGGNGGTTNGGGGRVDIVAGNGVGTGNGGLLTIQSGDGGDTAGTLNITTGAGGTGGTVRTGGQLNLTTGVGGDSASSSTNGAGGDFFLTTGAGGSLGEGGEITLQVGDSKGEAEGEDINLIAGTATTGPGIGGDIWITAGAAASSTTASRGGNITLTAGASAQAGFGGIVTITAGNASGSGINADGGDIALNLGSSGGGGSDPGSLIIGRSGSSGITTQNTTAVETLILTDTLTDGQTHSTSDIILINAPTMNGVAGGGTETCTTCSVMRIVGPHTGTNITFTNGPYVLNLGAGQSRIAPMSTAPSACQIGDIYTDTSGAFCFCSVANTWENLGGTGSCA